MTKEEKHFFEQEVFSKPGYKFSFEPDEELIENILKYKKSGKVLDLGCGKGGTALELAKRGFEVTCIDISKSAINIIKKQANKNNLKINVICADLENYNLEGDYDIIIATGVFHFLPKKIALKLIENCKEHTKINGLNLFEVMLEGDPSQEEDSEGCYFSNGELKNLYSNWKVKDYEEYEDYDEDEGWNNKLAYILAVKKE